MRTEAERITALHRRMDEKIKKRQMRKTGLWGAASAAFALCLMMLFQCGGILHTPGTAALYSGASILYDNAGGYVLVAVVSFAAAVAVTVACIRHHEKTKQVPEAVSSESTDMKD